MGISTDLQRIIVARLKAAVPSVAGRVYDSPPETAQMPYVSIGPSYWTDDSAECIRARTETVQVDIWANAKPDLRACKDSTDEVAAALDGWTDQGILTMPGLRVGLVRVVRDPDGITAHGIVMLDASIETQSVV